MAARLAQALEHERRRAEHWRARSMQPPPPASEREAALRAQLASLGAAVGGLEARLAEREAALARAEGAARQLSLLEVSAGEREGEGGSALGGHGEESGLSQYSWDGRGGGKDTARARGPSARREGALEKALESRADEVQALQEALGRKDGMLKRLKGQVERMG